MAKSNNAKINPMSPENVKSLKDYKISLLNLYDTLKKFKEAEGHNSNPTRQELAATVEEEIKVIKQLNLGKSDASVEERGRMIVILKCTRAILKNKSNEDAVNKYIAYGKEFKAIAISEASASAKLLRRLGYLMRAIGALAIAIGIVVGVAASAPIAAGTIGITGAVLLTAGMGLFVAGQLKNPDADKEIKNNNDTSDSSSKGPTSSLLKTK